MFFAFFINCIEYDDSQLFLEHIYVVNFEEITSQITTIQKELVV